MTSCHIAGDFAITKRKYLKGYSLITPSLFNKSNTKTIVQKKQDFKQTYKLICTNDSTIILANESRPIIAAISINKPCESISKTFFPPDTTKPKKTDSTKVDTNANATGTNTVSDKTIYRPALVAFILNCILPFLSLFLFVNLSGYSYLMLLALLLPLSGIILGYRSRKKILEYPDKYKGLGFANAAIALGYIYFALIILMFILFIYLMSTM